MDRVLVCYTAVTGLWHGQGVSMLHSCYRLVLKLFDSIQEIEFGTWDACLDKFISQLILN